MPDSTPDVSVVMPVHDTPPGFMREAIESVRGQSESRWELVIVLDAASEACAAVAHAAVSDDPDRVRVVGVAGGAPQGLSGARNLGIASTRASMLAFLDADDVLEPDALHVRRALLEANPGAAMMYGQTRYWFSWTGREQDRDLDWEPEPGVADGVHEPPTLVPLFLTGRASVPCPTSILVRRETIDAVGGFDTSFRALYEDQVFYARVALRHPILASARILDRYRQHPQSMTAVAAAQKDAARERFLAWLEGELVATGIQSRRITAAIATERWKMRHPMLTGAMRRSRKAVRRFRYWLTGRRMVPEPSSHPLA
jgi:glycosyltransferase involved in cell wall biosynthesis